MLPQGTWFFSTDETTPCTDLPEQEPQEESPYNPTLRIVLEQRICAQQETTIHAASTNQRTICREQDMPQGCKPEPETTITLNQESKTTNEQGATTFYIPQEGTYTIQATKEEQTTQTTFRARECLEEPLITQQPTTRETQRAQLTANPLTTTPQEQEPTPISQAQATYMLVLLLATSTLLLATIAYARRDTSPLILQARIAYEELKKR